MALGGLTVDATVIEEFSTLATLSAATVIEEFSFWATVLSACLLVVLGDGRRLHLAGADGSALLDPLGAVDAAGGLVGAVVVAWRRRPKPMRTEADAEAEAGFGLAHGGGDSDGGGGESDQRLVHVFLHRMGVSALAFV